MTEKITRPERHIFERFIFLGFNAYHLSTEHVQKKNYVI